MPTATPVECRSRVPELSFGVEETRTLGRIGAPANWSSGAYAGGWRLRCWRSPTDTGLTRNSPAGRNRQDYVGEVRRMLLAPACVRCRFTAADERLARDLDQRGISLEQLQRAIWLGCARKYVSHAQRPAADADHQSAVLHRSDRGSRSNRHVRQLLAARSVARPTNSNASGSQRHGRVAALPCANETAVPVDHIHRNGAPHHRNAGPHHRNERSGSSIDETK